MFARWKPMLLVALASTLGVLVAAQSTAPLPVTSPRRVEVLVLGHESTNHDSARFAPMLKAALAQHGFNFSYTADPADLNAAHLAQYDALIVYGDHDAITRDQEQALLDFVAGGKGFLPIHSASAAFRNSPAYIDLVGAQLERHGAGEFTAQIVDAGHPIVAGLEPFPVWDETYVHTRHNTSGRTVLMERVNGSEREPWTWVRTHGDGRVFYTAYGHDERVWAHPGFHLLIRNAITWAIGPQVAAQLAALHLQPVPLTDAPVPIPNYERRSEMPLYQQPLPPAEAFKHIQVPPGFELQLFASEPLVTGNPIAMAWDARGRLWLAETRDYPNVVAPDGQGNDVIRILEDIDGDGHADRATTFADRLNVVSSLVLVDDGVLVSQAGEITFLGDTTGDDRADVRRTLIRGFGTRDTHALASNLRYGLDNQIWGVVGYSGFHGTVGGETHNFNQAIYRFTRDASRLEHMATFTNNMWGLGFNETFDVFGSTANGEHSVHVAIPHPYYRNVAGLRGDGKRKIDGHYAMHPNTPRMRQVDVHGGFTAAAGHSFYTARSFPQEYWNRVAFINEPTGRLIHRAIVERRGSGFVERDGWNVAASDDEWFAPVHAEVGPDGALWILDFYDFIIQHNPTPAGDIAGNHPYLNGRGNAYETPLRDNSRGRVYRLVWKGATPSAPLALTRTEPTALVRALGHDNMFWRTTAQRLLVERGELDVVPQLVALVDNPSVDAIGLNSPALHALWTLHGLGAFDEGRSAEAVMAATRALTHPAAGVRKTAVMVLPRTAESVSALITSGTLTDPDLNVRLHALLALSEMPASAEAGRRVYDLSKAREVVEDEWLPEAVWIAASQHRDGFFDAYAREIGVATFARTAVRGARGETSAGVDWSGPALDDSEWMTIEAPGIWAGTPLGEHLGTVWFRRIVDLPASADEQPALVRFGIIDDTDVTYINGVRINATDNQRNMTRQYRIPAGVLKAGRNVIAVRISNRNGRGGFVPDPPPLPGTPPPMAGPVLNGMAIAGDGFNVSLSGPWRAKIEETWDGGRPREILTSVPIADQFLLANSPVMDLVTAGSATQSTTPRSAASASPSSSTPGALVVALSVVTGEMKFNLDTISARPGQRIEMTFDNSDDMQHNVVFFQRGDMAAYEAELYGSMNDANAQARGFVPDSPSVLFASPLLNARESVLLVFDAPTEPGDYPFVCSFPGHWMTMRGVLKVE